MEAILHPIINQINAILWNYILIYLLLGAGIYFSVRFSLVQLRLLPHSLRTLFHGKRTKGITPFQALATGVASRVGTGNIVGVAVALTVGGPGAIFWMWLTALLGMSSAFVESTLAQIFKVPHKSDNTFRGGPAYYIQLGLRSRFFGILFALSLVLAFAFIFNAVQANSISATLHESFGWDPKIIGIGLVLITAPIIFGGIRRVAHVAQIIVPIMALGYLALAFYITFSNIALLPQILGQIIQNAFGFAQATGGFAGFAVSQILMTGIKRGLFSNEGGMGSAPNAAATASTQHPVTQGLVQMIGVFIDTIVICTATAFIILCSGQYELGMNTQAAVLTQRAITSVVGPWGNIFMALAIFLFAYSSIIGNYAYAEGNITFIFKRPWVLQLFRSAVLGMVMFGSVASLPLVWDMADVSMGLMATINLVAILLLGKYALIALRDYEAQRRAGISAPVFSRHTIEEISEHLPEGTWENPPFVENQLPEQASYPLTKNVSAN